MDDDAIRFGILTQQVEGWLRVSRLLSAPMVVHLRFNCRFSFNVAMRGTRQHFRGMKSRARTIPYAWETVAATLLLTLGLCLFLAGCASTRKPNA